MTDEEEWEHREGERGAVHRAACRKNEKADEGGVGDGENVSFHR